MKKATLYGLGAYLTPFLAFAAVEDILIRGLWRPFDIESYYGLASSAVPAIYAILGEGANSPVFLLDTGAFAAYRIYLVGAICLASALLLTEMGSRSYGEPAGFMAGLLFALNMALLQGHLSIGDALAVLLVLASTFAFLYAKWDKRYILSGLLAGAAACFKPLLLVSVAVGLLFLYRNERRSVTAFTGAAAVPLIVVVMVAALSGGDIVAMALNSRFEALGFLTSDGYRPPDLLMAVGNIALSACLVTSILPLALLGYSRERGTRETYCLAAGLGLLITILAGQYLQYWYVALPFLALLSSSAFRARPKALKCEPQKITIAPRAAVK